MCNTARCLIAARHSSLVTMTVLAGVFKLQVLDTGPCAGSRRAVTTRKHDTQHYYIDVFTPRFGTRDG
ncbi:unnamed protein product [Danaus chrysippus]|uniref:(African queen) hypothetical protein n=1 Tax=Danaus chrysippus TaxID=151541 RepID=A0A8J2W6Z3_9NEOP|nr:unnamed protein product [Danaus chrysippus]